MSAEDRLRQLIQEIEAHNVTRGTIGIYALGTPEYETLIRHHFENGIKKVTPFVLEPSTEFDLIILMDLLASKKVAFAVKSGGHISIPKIYPPVGVLISMKKFNEIAYDEDEDTLDVGSGATFGEVYEFLRAPDYRGLGVVGGDPKVGVSGWLLGGGYSLLTNKYGLGMDNVVGFRVLTPGGTAQDLPINPTILNANPGENPDLFMALKGGGHNFGIVTRFTLKTYMGEERRPFVHFPRHVNESSSIKAALLAFIQSGNPEDVAFIAFKHEYSKSESNVWTLKSCITVAGSNWYNPQGGKNIVQHFIGDVGESMSLPDVYEAFALRHLPVSLETLQSDSEFVAFDPTDERQGNVFKDGDIIEKKILTSLSDQTDRNSFMLFKAGKKTYVLERDPFIRGRMVSFSVTKFTLKLLDEAEEQAKKLADMMPDHNGRRSSFDIWPFHKDSFNGIKTNDSAWPHEEGNVFGPLIGWFEWSGAENDGFWLTEIKKALEKLHEVALEEGCTIDGLPNYLNITLEKTSAKDIYTVNYDYLKVTRNKYDPTNVMAQAAGFII